MGRIFLINCIWGIESDYWCSFYGKKNIMIYNVFMLLKTKTYAERGISFLCSQLGPVTICRKGIIIKCYIYLCITTFEVILFCGSLLFSYYSIFSKVRGDGLWKQKGILK